MIFIRPVIVDTDEQFQNITRHQQDLYKCYSTPKKSWIYETEEGLDFLNLRRTYNTDDVDDEPEYHFAH
jgi:type III secretion protein C